MFTLELGATFSNFRQQKNRGENRYDIYLFTSWDSYILLIDTIDRIRRGDMSSSYR